MTLKNVLEDICAEEYALPANAPAHRFKRRHRKTVNAALYPDGLPKTERRLPLKRRILLAAAVVALAVLTGAAASYYRHNGFMFVKNKHPDIGKYYVMLVENRENAPKTIERIIYDDNVPEDFTLDDTYMGEGTVDEGRFVTNYYYSRSAERINKFGGQGAFIGIEQCVKSFFVDPIMEDYIVTSVEVKGCKGYAISAEEAMDVVVWDSGDYIHVINGLLTVDELLEIAENMIEK